ncbi:MAG: FAD-dependent oxidoreductase [Alphaproteobacteria bacterium]|nr:FAD-dependent oxidoreductase [Alphaproteobacteria bacterium]
MKTSDPRSALWSTTAAPAPETPPLEGDRRADACIVGGGFTGLSAALHLAETGVDTVLVEAEHPGFGASGRNHGQVVPGYSKHSPDEIVAKLGKERGEALNRWVQDSAALVFDLIRRHGIDCDVVHKGWLMPAHNAERLAVARAKHDQWAARGAAVDFLDRDQTAEITGSPHYIGAWMHRGGGNIQPLGYTRGLARAAQKAGAAIHGASPALSIERGNGRWQVRTPGGTVTAEKVVLATNAYGGDLWPALAHSIVPVRLFQSATAPLSDNIARSILPQGHSISDSRRALWSFRKDRDGRLVVGAAPLFTAGVRGPVNRIVGDHIKTVFPQVGDVALEHIWDGRVAVTTDRLPHLHELAEGLYAGLGYSGRGIAMATGMGKVLAERVRGKSLAELPVPATPLRPLPLHALSIPLARLTIAWHRWQDRG